MAPSHPTFSWRLYKTFTRTLHCVKTAYWQVKRNRAVICSLRLRCFHIFSVVEMYRQCVFKPLLQQWSILVLSHQLASFFQTITQLSVFLLLFSAHSFSPFPSPGFPSSSLRSRTPLSAFSSLSVPLPSMLLWGEPGSEAAGPRLCVSLCENWVSVLVCSSRARRSTGSSQPYMSCAASNGWWIIFSAGIYLQAEVLIYVWKVHGGSDFCLPTCSLCWFRCHLRASHDLSKDWGHPSPRS